jgi:hypothetical protein
MVDPMVDNRTSSTTTPALAPGRRWARLASHPGAVGVLLAVGLIYLVLAKTPRLRMRGSVASGEARCTSPAD